MDNSWFFIAILGVAINAVVYFIDVFLCEDEVFSSPLEPTIVSGVMQAMLWLAMPFVGFERPESWTIAVLAIFSGVLYTVSFFFYFKSIFSFGDITLISMLWNLLVAMVPILAYILLGEILTVTEYIGIIALFAGALVLSSSGGVNASLIPKVSRYMLVAVFLMGLSMVCMKGVYEHSTFWGGYFFYNFGIVGGAVLGYIFFLPQRAERRFQRTFRKFFGFFAGIEFLQLSSEFCSNLATNLGRVSLVSAIESIQPVFIILLSVGAATFGRFLFPKKILFLQSLFSIQLQNLPIKAVAFICMSFGIYFIK